MLLPPALDAIFACCRLLICNPVHTTEGKFPRPLMTRLHPPDLYFLINCHRWRNASAINSNIPKSRPMITYGGGAAPVARAMAASATFRESTMPVNVGFTEPTVTNKDWSAQKAFATLWKRPFVSVTEL